MSDNTKEHIEILLDQVDNLEELIVQMKEAHALEKESFEGFKEDLVSWLNFWGSHARSAIDSPDIAVKDMILYNIAESFEKTIPELKIPDEKIQNESQGNPHLPGRCLCE